MSHHPRRVGAMTSFVLTGFVLANSFAAQPSVMAAVPRTIHYQGKLTEPDGSPIVGEHTVTLRLYAVATGGTALWEEAHALDLSRSDGGIFSVVLGSLESFGSAISFNEPLWLSTEVDGQGEFSPRQPLSAVAYSINADLMDGLDSSQMAQLDASGKLPDGRLSANVSLLGGGIESAEITDGTLTATDTAETFLTAGSGVTVTKASDSWQIAASGGTAGITGVTAGVGLTGGGTSGTVTLDVGVGTGLVAAPDAISVDVGTAANQIVQLDAAGALPAVSGAALTGLAIDSSEVTDETLTAADTAATFLTAGSGVTLTKGPASWEIAAVGTGGDITGVTAGTGLTGGATSGEATLSVNVGTAANQIVQLDAAGALPAVSGAALTGLAIDSSEVTDETLTAADTAATFLTAGSGVTVTKGATAWQIDATGSGGTVTSITAGTGLTGGTITTSGTLGLSVPVSVANGGTGATTLAAGGLLIGQGASALTTTGVLAKGALIVGDGAADPALLSVGASHSLLMADPTQASGLKWAAGCMPIGGTDSTGRSGTFQMGAFGASDTNNRLDRLWPAPVSGTATTFRAFVNQAPGSGASWTVRLRKNAANATLSCTISGTATACSTSGTESFAAGDRLGAEFTESGTAASTLGSGWSGCVVPN